MLRKCYTIIRKEITALITLQKFKELVEDLERAHEIDFANYRWEKENHESTDSTCRHFNSMQLAMEKAYEILEKGIDGTYWWNEK